MKFPQELQLKRCQNYTEIAVSETCIVYKTLIMHKIGVFNRISKDVWFIYADNGFPRGLTNEHILAVWTEPCGNEDGFLQVLHTI